MQEGLIVGAIITVVAIPLMVRAGQSPVSKALLLQNFGGNLTLVLAVVAAVSLTLCAVRVARDLR